MIIDYNKLVRIYEEIGSMFARPGVVKPGANIAILRRGRVVFEQTSVTGARGDRLVVQEVNTLDRSGHRQTRLIVKHTPPHARP